MKSIKIRSGIKAGQLYGTPGGLVGGLPIVGGVTGGLM